MARDGIRNPASMHQKIMQILFGKQATSIPTAWHQWPEPQKSIYSRLLQKGFILVPGAEYKKAVKAIDGISDLYEMILSWYPNAKIQET